MSIRILLKVLTTQSEVFTTAESTSLNINSFSEQVLHGKENAWQLINDETHQWCFFILALHLLLEDTHILFQTDYLRAQHEWKHTGALRKMTTVMVAITVVNLSHVT